MSFVPANEGISKLKPYQPGKPISELERELGITDIVKLASNETRWAVQIKSKKQWLRSWRKLAVIRMAVALS